MVKVIRLNLPLNEMNKKNQENLTWLEIDINALKHNTQALTKRLAKRTKVMAVVKGNAYGHGMFVVAKTIEKLVDYFAVFDFVDAMALRKAGIKKNILVLCPADKAWIRDAVVKNIELTATSCAFLNAVEKTILPKSKKLKIHLNVETGLGRDGFVESEISKVRRIVSSPKNFSVIGLMTHFSGAESRVFDIYTGEQVEKLIEWKQLLSEIDIHPIVHASGTAGSILDAKYQLDMVRLGIGLYGLWPSEETKEIDTSLVLKPALSWKTKIIEIKNLKKGSSVGYDQTFKLTRDSMVAVLPVGYFDGLPRSASGKGEMITKGQKVPQIGRIMMNMCVIDVTDLSRVSVGDTVTIIGSDGRNTVSTDDWAMWSDTINYDIVTSLNPSIPRRIA